MANDARAVHNLLRPEAIESIFYLWRFTKDPMYREWGWKMFLAFEKHCRVASGGYVGIRNVRTSVRPSVRPSFQFETASAT